jgi:molecular chaperone GrpE (heat shock protein)
MREKETQQKNKIIHDKRVRLTEDFKKAEQIWVDAKKESNNNKSTAIQSFATSLIELGKHFKETKKLEGEQHSTDLVEGFDNTARLFYNTLEKFKIKQTEVEAGTKIKSKDQFEVLSHEKAEKSEQKDTVAKVIEQGW